MDTPNTAPTPSSGGPPASSPPTARPSSLSRNLSLCLFALLGLVGLGSAFAVYYSPRYFLAEEKQPTYPAIKVGGTSVVWVIAENRWKKMYREQKGVSIEYDSSGTTAGVNKLIDGQYAVVFTHGPLTGELKKKAETKGEVLQIPVVLCGVAPIYNVQELRGKTVNFTGEVLADIFLGKIATWDDKALRALNPGLPLPPKPIKFFHREDSSGTTYVLTEFLCSSSKAWRDKFGGPSAEVAWPAGTGAKRNLGVASAVYDTDGALALVDRLNTSYDEMVIDYGAVKNPTAEKPTFVKAEPDSFVAALKGVKDIPADLVFSLANQPGPEAYPISGVIYAICYRNPPADQKQNVSTFMHWISHEGQAGLKHSKYAALPPELIPKVEERLKLLPSN